MFATRLFGQLPFAARGPRFVRGILWQGVFFMFAMR
jgi:hypothetical protein